MKILSPHHIAEGALYPINSFQKEVKFTTRRLEQGWGCWHLSPKELGDMFGYDIALHFDQFKNIVP